MKIIKKTKKVEKIWGSEEWIVNNELYCYKKLYLKKGYQCSIHQHYIKDETFIIESGQVEMYTMPSQVTIVPVKRTMNQGDQIRIKPNVYHKFTGISDAVIIEISTQHMDEDSYRITQSGKVE